MDNVHVRIFTERNPLCRTWAILLKTVHARNYLGVYLYQAEYETDIRVRS